MNKEDLEKGGMVVPAHGTFGEELSGLAEQIVSAEVRVRKLTDSVEYHKAAAQQEQWDLEETAKAQRVLKNKVEVLVSRGVAGA